MNDRFRFLTNWFLTMCGKSNALIVNGVSLVALLAAMIGCGSAQEFPLVPVSGIVTFAGGPCPKPGTIDFSPMTVEEGLPQRPGRARFSEDGYFEATSFEEGDGLVPGAYSVRITCWEQPPSENDPTSFERFNLVPSTFHYEIVVEPDADAMEVNIDVPKKSR
jgi:hypothetical protein